MYQVTIWWHGHFHAGERDNERQFILTRDFPSMALAEHFKDDFLGPREGWEMPHGHYSAQIVEV